MISKDFNLDKFKKQSVKVSGFLNEKGYSIPKSTILHALSIFLEEKNWNTLSAKLNKKDNITHNKKIEYVVDEHLIKEDFLLLLTYIYKEIFSQHFHVFDKHLLNNNLKEIIDEILHPDGRYPLPINNIFPTADGLINKMSLIGDEQILKISFSYNKKIEYNYYPMSLFDLLRSAIYLMIKPDAITASELGNNILGHTEEIYLDSKYRSKAYFYIPISMKEPFVKHFNYDSSSGAGFAIDPLIQKKGKDNADDYIEVDFFKKKLILLGIEDIEVSCCFLNEPHINDFLKTR